MTIHQSSFVLTSLMAMVVFFGFTLSALANSELLIEIELTQNETEVEVNYKDDDDKAIEEEYTYATDDLDEIYAQLAEELDFTIEELEDAATVERDSDQSEDENDDGSDNEADEEGDNESDEQGDNDDDDRGHGNDADGCDGDNPGRGLGLNKRCDSFGVQSEQRQKRPTSLNDILGGVVNVDEVEDTKELRNEILGLLRQLISLILSDQASR